MACSEQGARDISDPGRVSSLIRVVVQVVWACCGLLFVILYTITARLIKSSRLYRYFVSCEEGDDDAAATGTHLAHALLRVEGVNGGKPDFSEGGQGGNRFFITSSCGDSCRGGGNKIAYCFEDSTSSSLSVARNGSQKKFWAECVCGCPLLLLQDGGEGTLSSFDTNGVAGESGQTQTEIVPRVVNVIHAACVCQRCGSDEINDEILGGGKRFDSSEVDDAAPEILGSTTLLRLRNGGRDALRRRRRRQSASDENESCSGLLVDKWSDSDNDVVTKAEDGEAAVEDIESTVSKVGVNGLCECLRCRNCSKNGSENVTESGIAAVSTDGCAGCACAGSANERKERELSPTTESHPPPSSSSSPSSCASVYAVGLFRSSSSLNPEGSITTGKSEGDLNSKLILELSVGDNRGGASRHSASGIVRECGGDAKDGGEEESCDENGWNSGRRRKRDATDGGNTTACATAAAITAPESLPNRRRRVGPPLGSHGGICPAVEDGGDGLSIDATELPILRDAGISSDWSNGVDAASVALSEKRRMSASEGGFGEGGDGKSNLVRELERALQREKLALAELYAELEEEREAASVSASEAMAMINRLQEEKAAVQMEARQYQRMAEEREVYDEEALNMLEEILLKRDEEMSALQEEVSSYRTRLLSAKVAENLTAGVENADAVTPRIVVGGGSSAHVGSENAAADGSSICSYDGKRKSSLQQLDQKLVADIKEWLHAAKEKGLPAKVEDLDISGSMLRLGNSIGRKNLLDSFCTVAAEESHSYGVEIEDVDTPRPCHPGLLLRSPTPTPANVAGPSVASGHESLQEESPRQEAGLRDDGVAPDMVRKVENSEQESVEQKPGSMEGEGEEEELRRVWKSTRRGFKEEENETTAEAEAAAAASAANRNPPSPSTVETGASQVKDERTSEEKRVSVLEYVWKFEEQLHQLGTASNPPSLVSWKSGIPPANNSPSLVSWKSGPFPAHHSPPPPVSWRTGLANVDAATPPHSNSTSLPELRVGGLLTASSSDTSDTDSRSKKSAGHAKPGSVKSRLRKLANGAKNVSLKTKRDRFNTSNTKEVRYGPAGNVGDHADGDHRNHHPAPGVTLPANPFHDAYTQAQAQTQRKPSHYVPEANAFRRRGLGADSSVEVSLCMTAPASELVRGEVAYSQQLAHCTEGVIVDDEDSLALGKDVISRSDYYVHGSPLKRGVVEEATKEGLEFRDGMGDWIVATTDPGLCEQQEEHSDRKEWVRSSEGVISVAGVLPGEAADTVGKTGGRISHGRRLDNDEREGFLSSDDDALRRSGVTKHLSVRQRKRNQEMVEHVPSVNSGQPNDSASFIKEVESIHDTRHAGQAQPSKLARHLILGGDPGTCRGDHKVGLSRLLHASPQDQQRKPIERARNFKAVDVS